jgi:hypothetical protein
MPTVTFAGVAVKVGLTVRKFVFEVAVTWKLRCTPSLLVTLISCVGTLILPTGALNVNAVGLTMIVEVPTGLMLMGMETAE